MIIELVILFTFCIYIWLFGIGLSMLLSGDVTGVYYVNMGVFALMVNVFQLMIYRNHNKEVEQ